MGCLCKIFPRKEEATSWTDRRPGRALGPSPATGEPPVIMGEALARPGLRGDSILRVGNSIRAGSLLPVSRWNPGPPQLGPSSKEPVQRAPPLACAMAGGSFNRKLKKMQAAMSTIRTIREGVIARVIGVRKLSIAKIKTIPEICPINISMP